VILLRAAENVKQIAISSWISTVWYNANGSDSEPTTLVKIRRMTTMKKPVAFATLLLLALSCARPAHAWISLVDFNDSAFPPEPLWAAFSNEGNVGFVDLGGGNMALRLDSPDHSTESPIPGTYYNEYYVTDIPGYEKVGAARFRLDSFTPTGKENLLAVSSPVAAPTITLVDGDYWIWSYLSPEPNQPILKLGPAVAGEFHEAYIMITVTATDDMGTPTAGGAKVWWDGSIVYDAPVDGGGDVNAGGYVEFGSGTYWQVNAGTVVDFDWVGFGDVNDFPVPPDIDADYNSDGVVDAADYVVWRKNDGSPPGYEAWRADFGKTFGAAAGSSSTGPQSATVPEPSALMMLATGMLAAFLPRARKWQQPH
jgi:hypothetical protein